jgi:ABC-type nickel/cobalt efflux system permease component RcnA
MDTTQWIIVAVVVLVVVALAAWLVTRQRTKKQQEHAEHLRQEAHEHATEIPETQVRAKEAEAQAERARLEAERAAREAEEAKVASTQQQAMHEDRLRTADEIDPRVDTRSDDYAPGVGTRTTDTSTSSDPDTVLDADDPRRDGTEGSTRY